MSSSFAHHPSTSSLTKFKAKFLRYLDFNLTLTHLHIQIHHSKTPPLVTLNSFVLELISKLRIAPTLSHLTLNLQEAFPEYNQEGQATPLEDKIQSFLKTYTILLQHFRHLQKVSVALPCNSSIVTSYMKRAPKLVSKYCKKLQQFELILPSNSNLTLNNKNLLHFIRNIGRSAPKLHSLKFICLRLNLEHKSPNLSKMFNTRRMANLKKLALHIPAITLAKATKNHIDPYHFGFLKGSRRLRILDLAFSDELMPTDVKAKDRDFHVAHSFRNLTGLKLAFSNFHSMTGRQIRMLTSQIISKLPELKSFALDLHQNEGMNDIELKSLSNTMTANLQKLTQLSLSFSSAGITERGVSYISSMLMQNNYSKLATLSLNFRSGGTFSNKILTQLAENIGRNIPKLKRLGLSFISPGSNRRTPGALKVIMGTKEVSNKGIAKLGKIIADRLMYLQMIQLRLEHQEQITNEGVENMCTWLGKINHLKKLNLNFRLCGKVTPEVRRSTQEILTSERKIKMVFI